MDTHITVAIDGPSGAGKSTIARAAARRFGLIYVDTGAIYRTVGLAGERAGVNCSDADAMQALLPALRIELVYDAAGEQRMLLNGEDVSETIRLPEVSLLASRVSALPVVRAFLLDMQRSLARTHSVVMDGRDIGTVVLPDAGLKIFLSASAECRAQRRWRQLQEKGIQEPYADVLRELEQRDYDDTHRAIAPLKAAPDAVHIDTSDLTLEQSVDAVCAAIRTRFGLEADMRELRVAKSAGFCFGVSRSVKMAEEMLAAETNCYSLGELIHNDDVVQHLRSEGLTVADGPEQIPQGASVIIRSHGVSRAEFEAVQRTGATVYDATCPKVKRIHEIVADASAERRQPVIIGAADHPEVRAICGWCISPIVVNDASQLAARIADGTIDCAKPLTVVIQTTQTQEKLLECQKIIKKECTNAKLFDTICGATFTRQTEAAQMARNCDAMVVVGGSHSANSRHLYEICCSACANVQFIENAAQLDTSAFVHADTVGLTAGASVPAWIIKEVKQKMSDEILTQENPMETENFDEMLEASLKPIYNGEKVTGTVVAISATEISVDIGTKYSGFIPTSEFTDDGIKVEDVLHVGDSIEASVVRVNDVEGTAMLSKKRLTP